jgi:predicted transposase YdaD
MQQGPDNPHDRFFLMMARDPPSIEVLIQGQLPAEMLATVVPGSLELMPSSFVDAVLGRSEADVVYQLRLNMPDGDERAAYAFLLFEHKSAPDRLTPLQLLRYQMRIWENWLERSKGLPLPPILSIVVHQGPPAWPYRATLQALLQPLPEGLRAIVPDFQYVVIDLATIDDDALPPHRRLRPMLLALKYARRRDLEQKLPAIIDGLPPLTKMEIQQTLTYLVANRVGVPAAAIAAALRTSMNRSGIDTMGIEVLLRELGIESREDGLKEGLEQGLEQGLAQAQRRSLTKLLTRRFGLLPAAVLERIEAAEVTELDSWFDAGLEGADLASLFPEVNVG